MANATVTIPPGLATRTAAPGALHAALKTALKSLDDRRREGASGAEAALNAAMEDIEAQRRAPIQ
jgi:hypothetical protein